MRTQTVVVGLFDKMWMPANIRRKILQYFFENGILVVLDNASGKHEELDCLNIYVQQIGRSMLNKGLCKKTYAWSHAYFTLNDEGIAYLRNYFGLPAAAAPLTLQPRQADFLDHRTEGDRSRRGGRGRGFGAPGRGNFRGGRGRGGRGGFRRNQGEEAGEAAEAPEAPQTEQ